ncbi:hypothetical protein B0H13DRAFT_1036707 [Mycena leptocephala]|nr:hypothetical protein B0H13DRAFT_1036707 [Mycena leptocephala]
MDPVFSFSSAFSSYFSAIFIFTQIPTSKPLAMFAPLFLGLVLIIMPFNVAMLHDTQSTQPGDQAVFHFNYMDHTVTRSAFDKPRGWKEGCESPFMPALANGPS